MVLIAQQLPRSIQSRGSVSDGHRTNPGPYAGHGGRQSASFGDNPEHEELIDDPILRKQLLQAGTVGSTKKRNDRQQSAEPSIGEAHHSECNSAVDRIEGQDIAP
jgi:hypothetical protein